jgi:hypothetical protein
MKLQTSQLLFILLLATQIATQQQINFTTLFNSPTFSNLKRNSLPVLDLKTESKWTEEFPCRQLNSNHPPPEDASKLRFSDIKVIMALGDSATAGFGMVTQKEIFSQIFKERS